MYFLLGINFLQDKNQAIKKLIDIMYKHAIHYIIQDEFNNSNVILFKFSHNYSPFYITGIQVLLEMISKAYRNIFTTFTNILDNGIDKSSIRDNSNTTNLQFNFCLFLFIHLSIYMIYS